jgi:hypothetical protein
MIQPLALPPNRNQKTRSPKRRQQNLLPSNHRRQKRPFRRRRSQRRQPPRQSLLLRTLKIRSNKIKVISLVRADTRVCRSN